MSKLRDEVETAVQRTQGLEASLKASSKAVEEKATMVNGMLHRILFYVLSRSPTLLGYRHVLVSLFWAVLKTCLEDGFSSRNALLVRFGALCDASAALLTQLGFPARDDMERLPGDLQLTTQCYGALRTVSAAVMEELDLPTSDDPMRLP